MKKWNKKNRAFLNPNDKECLGAVSWFVSFSPSKPDAKEKYFQKPIIEGSIAINREGSHHYICRKADMRAIQTMKRELCKFEDAMQQAFVDQESDKDAKSKG